MSCTSDNVETKGIILMYHRVAEVESDPWSLSVTPKHFAEHLKVIKQFAVSMRLGEFYNCSNAAVTSPPFVAITFDDGYADNLYQAGRILKLFHIPATFFLASGYIDSKTGFWWDELEQIILRPGTLTSLSGFTINGKTYNINWDGDTYTFEDYQRNRNWRVGEEDPSLRHTLFRTLHGLLREQQEKQRQALLDHLRIWSGKKQVVYSDPQVLSTQEVIALAQEELFEIGAHTLTHCDLVSLPKAQQQEEIIKSREFLEKLSKRTVNCFSYPYGGFTAETAALVRDAGFTCAVTAGNENIVQSSTDRFQLPRVPVHDWPAEEFAARISRVLES